MMDEREFQALYETFARRLVLYGIHAGVEQEIAKELMQQAYQHLLSNHDNILKKHNNLAGWLIRTNHNLVHWELASNRRKYEVPMPEGFEPPSLEEYRFPLGDTLPAGLSQRHKTILVLRYEEQLSYKEIAPRMKISEGYACVLTRRALKELRKLLASEEKRLNRGICFVT